VKNTEHLAFSTVAATSRVKENSRSNRAKRAGGVAHSLVADEKWTERLARLR
jgi:hypothetical protein